jgi:hypothetical protein
MRIDMKTMSNIIANYYGLTLKDFRDPDRHRMVARPRQIMMYFARKNEGIYGKVPSYPKIGIFLCRDHTTIIAGERRIKKLLETDAQILLDVSIISKLLLKELDDFKPFKSAAQSAMVFLSGVSPSHSPAPDNLAGRASCGAPGHFFSQDRPSTQR